MALPDVLGILQARTSSSRLPGKVLKPILGRPMILHQLDRLARSGTLRRLVVATSTDPSDDRLTELVSEAGHAVHRGELDDVLARFCGVLAGHPSEHVVRLTGDCPLADPALIDETVRHHLATGADYTSNALQPTFPDGLDVEVVRSEVLRLAGREARLASEREHVTSFIWTRPDRFRLAALTSPIDRSAMRWTVDTPDDFRFATAVYEALYPREKAFGTDAVLAFLDVHPEIAAINAGSSRNEGYAGSLATEASAAQVE